MLKYSTFFRTVLLMVFSLACVGVSLCAAADAESLVRPFVQVDTTAHKPAYPILSPLPDGPLKILFIGRRDRVGTFAASAGARLDCLVETVLTESRDRIGLPDEVTTPDDPLSSGVLTARLARLLMYHWDAVWCDQSFGSFPEEVQSALLEQVHSGAGMVYVGELTDFKGRLTGKQSDQPLDKSGYPAIGDVQGIDSGDGRILVFPRMKDALSSREAEDYVNAAVYALYRSAGRPEDVLISGIEIPHRRIEHEVVAISKYKVHLVNHSEPDSMMVVARFRDEKGRLAYENSDMFLVDEGRSFVLMEYPPLTVGLYSLDISLLCNGKVRSFSGTEFLVETEDYIDTIRLWSTLVAEGAFVLGTVRFSFVLPEGIVMDATVFDSRGVVIDFFNVDLVPGRKSADFSYKVKPGTDKALTIEFHLFKNNEMVHRYEVSVMIERKQTASSFTLGVIDDPAGGTLQAYERLRRYRTLAENGVDIVAPVMEQLTDAGEAYSLVFDTALTGADILPILSFSPDPVDEKAIRAFVDTLGKSPVHSFGMLNAASPGLCPDNTFISNVNVLCDVLERSESDKRATVIGLPPSPFCGPVQQGIHDRTQVAEGRISPLVNADGPETDMVMAFMARTMGDSTGYPGLLINGMHGGMGNAGAYAVLPWRALFNGAKSLWWYPMEGGRSAALTPQGTLSPAFGALAAGVKEIGDGIDRLLFGCDRPLDDIAILYDDTPSGDTGGVISSAASLLAACNDLGYTAVLLPMSRCDSLLSPDRDFKAVLIPAGIHILPDTVGLLGSFMDAGGTIVAETLPIIQSADRQSAVDVLFGIAGREPGMVMPDSTGILNITGQGETAGITEGMLAGLMADSPLRVLDGTQVLASVGDVPVATENMGAQGAGLLLNIRYNQYDAVRYDPMGAQYRDLISWCLARSGIDRPGVMVTVPEPDGTGVGLTCFADSTALYIGVVRTAQDVSAGQQVSRLVRIDVDLPGKTRFAYDVRRGTYLGARASFPLDLPPGDAAVVSLLPYRVRGIEIALESTVVGPGEQIKISASLSVREKNVQPGHHIFRVQLYDPDGNSVLDKSRLEDAPNGKMSVSIRGPVKERPGQWSVVVEDVATGVKSSRSFLLRKPRKRILLDNYDTGNRNKLWQ